MMFFFKKNKKLAKIAPALIVVAAVLWALDGILRRSLFSLPPITIVFYEHLIGSIILVPFVLRQVMGIKFTKKVIILTGAISLLSGLLGTLWFTTALVKTNFIPFSVVFLLQKLQPIFAIGAAAIFLKEKITGQYKILAAVALIAAYFVTFPNGIVNFATGGGTIVAAMYAAAAAFAWGTATVFSKMLIKETNQNIATGLRFFTTTVFAFFAVMALGAGASLQAVETSQFFRLGIIALSTGMVALWIYYTGLRYTQAKISTLLELTFPVLAVGIDVVLYDSVLLPSQYLAALILVFVIYKLGKLQADLNTKKLVGKKATTAETKLS